MFCQELSSLFLQRRFPTIIDWLMDKFSCFVLEGKRSSRNGKFSWQICMDIKIDKQHCIPSQVFIGMFLAQGNVLRLAREDLTRQVGDHT